MKSRATVAAGLSLFAMAAKGETTESIIIQTEENQGVLVESLLSPNHLETEVLGDGVSVLRIPKGAKVSISTENISIRTEGVIEDLRSMLGPDVKVLPVTIDEVTLTQQGFGTP